MKKVLAMAMAMAMFASPLLASNGRISGFGYAGWFITDSSEIVNIPAAAVNFTGILEANLNTIAGNDDSGMAVVALGPGALAVGVGGGVGLSLLDKTNYESQLAAVNSAANLLAATIGLSVDSMQILTPTNLGNIIYALNLGETGSIGVGFSMFGASNKVTYKEANSVTTTDDVSYENSDSTNGMAVTVGYEGKDMGAINKVQVAAGFKMLTVDNKEFASAPSLTLKPVDNSLKSDAGTGIDAAVRAFLGENGSHVVVAAVGMQTLNTTLVGKVDGNFVIVPDGDYTDATDTNIENKQKLSDMGWNAGYAMKAGGDKGMVLGGVILSGNTTTKEMDRNNLNTTVSEQLDKQTESGIYANLVLAAEKPANDWVTIRGNVSVPVFGSNGIKDEEDPRVTPGNNTIKTSEEISDLGAMGVIPSASVGLSANLGDFTFDAVITNWLFSLAQNAASVSGTWRFGAGE